MRVEYRAKPAWAMLRRSSFYVKTNKNMKKIFYIFLPIFFLFFLSTPRRGIKRTKLFFYDYLIL